MKVRDNGQTLVFTLVTMPLFLILTGLCLRSGKTLIVHQHVMSHCNYVVLEALRIQAQALEALGRINPHAARIIDTRRAVDAAIEAAVLTPPLMAELIAARKILNSAQKSVDTSQRYIMQRANIEASRYVQQEANNADRRKLTWLFNPGMSHAPPVATLPFNLQKPLRYQAETGSPLEFKPGPSARATYVGEAKIQTENFLPLWQGAGSSTAMKIKCEAKIEMKNLEGPWTVILSKADNH